MHRPSSFRNAARCLGAPLCAAAGLLIGLARNPGLFLHPAAVWEDGTLGIGLYSNPAAPVFHFQVGYVHAVPDLVFWVAMRTLPLVWVPYCLAGVALALTACVPAAAYCLFRHAFGASLRAACWAAIIVAALPLDDWVLISNVDYSIWHLAAILFFCLWNEVPEKPVAWLFYVGWRIAILASNPLCLPALLVWLARAWRTRRREARATFVVLFAAGLCYALFGIAHRPVLASGERIGAAQIAAMALRVAVQGGLLDIVPGSALLPRTPSGLFYAGLLAAAALVLLLVAIARSGSQGVRRAWLEAALLAAGIGCSSLIPALGRGAERGADYLLDGSRFTYVPRLFWCCGIAAGLIAIWPSRTDQAARRGALVAALGVLLALMLAGRSGAYQADTRAASARLLRFLARGVPAGQTASRLDRNDIYGDWSITICHEAALCAPPAPGVMH